MMKEVKLAATCLCDGVAAGIVDDHEIKMAAQVDAGFVSGVEDKKIVSGRHFFMFQYVGPRLLLL